MNDFDSPLDPGYPGHQPDLERDEATVKTIVETLEQAIQELKCRVMYGPMNSDSGIYHGLRRLGQIQDMHNRLTGCYRRMEYLFSDDGECCRYVAGFFGDPAGVMDSKGRPLRVGDVLLYEQNGVSHEKLLHLDSKGQSHLPQEWMDSHNAELWISYEEADARTVERYSDPAVVRRSCLMDYYMAHDRARAPVRQPQKAAREER